MTEILDKQGYHFPETKETDDATHDRHTGVIQRVGE